MDLKKLKAELIFDEGRRTIPYKDPSGHWTGGVGHNLDAHKCSWMDISVWLKAGIPDVVIDEWFSQDVDAAINCCRLIFPAFDQLSDNRQRVLVNMAFALMYELKDWHHLKAAITAKDWQGVALSIMDSEFAHEAPNRCMRLAARMIEK